MFRLEEQEVRLASVTNRVELHGDDIEPGCTLAIEITGINTLLDRLEDGLRAAFYEQEKINEGGQEVLIDDGHLPKVKHPLLGEIPWSYVGAGYRAVLGGGLNEESDLNFIKCELKKFKFKCEQGGSVKLKFNINCHPTAEEAGRLYELNGNNVDLTLEPPSPEQQAQMELDEHADEDEWDEALSEALEEID